jgi:two-component system chemotaxis response regulator CheY
MKKILIVDDAVTVRMYHKNIMEACGFAVEEAVNGLEALEKIESFTPDLCLVDVNMSKMDGYRFTEALREHDTLKQLPVIMISTEEEVQDKTKAYLAGANFYIVKPAKKAYLQAVAQTMLGAA